MGQSFRATDLNDVKVHSVMLGEGIKGFIYVSRKNVPHIFINESLSPECTAETLAHELYHLKHDNLSRGIGLDKQQDESEQKANKFAARNFHRLIDLMRISAI